MSDFRGNMAAASWEEFSIEQILCTPSRLGWRWLVTCLFAQSVARLGVAFGQETMPKNKRWRGVSVAPH